MQKYLEAIFLKAIFLAATFGLVQLLIVTGVINPFIMDTLTTICINIILAVSLNLITGFTGQFSLGHAGLCLLAHIPVL